MWGAARTLQMGWLLKVGLGIEFLEIIIFLWLSSHATKIQVNEQKSKFLCYSAMYESYQTDCFATSYKSTLRIWLFWRNCKNWQINPTDNSYDLLSFPETILHVNELQIIFFDFYMCVFFIAIRWFLESVNIVKNGINDQFTTPLIFMFLEVVTHWLQLWMQVKKQWCNSWKSETHST